MKKRSKLGWLCALTFVALSSVGGCNIFSDLADKATDEVVIEDVRNFIDASKWTDAILKWNSLTTVGKEKREYRLLLATAYAGRAGLNVLNLITTLSANTGSSNEALFILLMRTFKGSTYFSYRDTILAQEIIHNISIHSGERTADENVFMALLQLTKIGVLLAHIADADADGNVDTAFDNCSSTQVTDMMAAEVLSGIGTALMSLGNALSNVGDGIAAVSTLCTSSAVSGYCYFETPRDILNSGGGAVLLSVARTIIGETNLAIGLKKGAGYEISPSLNPCP